MIRMASYSPLKPRGQGCRCRSGRSFLTIRRQNASAPSSCPTQCSKTQTHTVNVHGLSWFLGVSNVGAAGWGSGLWSHLKVGGVAPAHSGLLASLRVRPSTGLGAPAGVVAGQPCHSQSGLQHPVVTRVSAAQGGGDRTEHKDQMEGRLVPRGESRDETLGVGRGSRV